MSHEQKTAPYALPVRLSGGVPTTKTDVPIACVFIVLYLAGAVTHMTLLQLNRRRKHKFLISGVLFGLCMARTVTMSLRIAWARHSSNISLAIAAQVFVSAGVLLAYIVNLIFMQRLLRAYHPHIGRSAAVRALFGFLFFCIFCGLVTVITGAVQSHFTLQQSILRKDITLQRFGATLLLTIAALPLFFVLLMPRFRRRYRLDRFGSGRTRHKLAILGIGSALLVVGSAYRTANAYRSIPLSRPDNPWYLSRGAFYSFNFVIELLVIYFYAATRIDRRFYIPNGAKGLGSYGDSRETRDLKDANDIEKSDAL